MRTQEEIIKQCEKRMCSLEKAAADKKDKKVPNPSNPFCSTCKWEQN